MSANNNKCSIGVLNGDKCHKDDFTRRPCSFKVEEIEEGELRLIKWRSGFCDLNTICHHHKIKYLQRYIVVIHLEDIPSSSVVSLFYRILLCYKIHNILMTPKDCETS